MSIVWIAGWPHCGSTLTREFIQEVFEHNSFSQYPEASLAFRFGDKSVDFSLAWQEDPAKAYAACRDSEKLFVIKTHEAPVDDSPAIYVQRDGRDAAVALSHFWEWATLHDIITGQRSQFADWSTYYRAWHPTDRPNTIVVEFEETIKTPGIVAERIGKLIGLTPLHEFTDSQYAEGKEKWPKLYKDRMDFWKDELKGADLEMFYRLHGDVMKECGYAR